MSAQEIQAKFDELNAKRELYEAATTVRNNIFMYGFARGLTYGIFVTSPAIVGFGAYELSQGRSLDGFLFIGIGVGKAAVTALMARPGLRRMKAQTE